MADENVRTLPDGFVPVQASYGDDNQSTDVTTSVMAKLRGDTLDVTADKGLIPALSFADTAELTKTEQDAVTQQANKECGGPNDQKCIETMRDRFKQAKLQEKLAAQTQAGAIKGERLTIIAINSKGQQRTFYIPKGGRVLSGKAVADYAKNKKTSSSLTKSWQEVQPLLMNALKWGALAFLYVYSVLSTWRNLTESGYGMVRWIGLATAILVPYSGFLIQLGVYGGKRYLDEIMTSIEKTSELKK